MREIRKVCKQLKVARRLIRDRSLASNRLALVLLDNIVDVYLFKATKQRLALLNSSWMYEKERPTRKKQLELLRSFPKRCFFLTKNHAYTGPALSNEQAHLLIGMHRLRNETYHEGVIRDRIMRVFVHSYAAAVPNILSELWSGWVRTRMGQSIKKFLKRYGVAGESLSREAFGSLCVNVLGTIDHSPIKLRTRCVKDLRKRIARARELFDYATKESNFKGNDVFKWSEFWDWAKETTNFDTMDRDYNQKVSHFMAEHYKSFEPKMRIEHLDEINERIEVGFEGEASEAQTLTTYWQVDDVLKPMEEFIFQLAQSYEEHLQLQIDIARGK